MRKYLFLLVFMLTSVAHAQDTFSIVAADSTTREVGSAGASCVDLFSSGIGDASFLGDLLPDTGAINSQASYLASNQKNARTRMRAGDMPSQIIDWLVLNDVQANVTIRQYGVVGFTGSNVSAAGFTGSGCQNYKNHINGSINGIYYSIQGNILLGPQVLDSMEVRFRNADGDIACRLMAALQGAKMTGADTRCTTNGTSSLFSFIKVAQPGDAYGIPSFILRVRTHNSAHLEPIDSLQVLFSQAHSCVPVGLSELAVRNAMIVYPNPGSNEIVIKANPVLVGSEYRILDLFGRNLINGILFGESTVVDIHQLISGMYFILVENSNSLRFIKN